MRYKAVVMYDGTNFHGFQSQDNLRTVQQEIEAVLKIVCKKETKIYPAGRTDTGVHAYGQVFHFDYEVEMKEWQIKNAIKMGTDAISVTISSRTINGEGLIFIIANISEIAVIVFSPPESAR